MRFSVVTCDVSGNVAKVDVFEAHVAILEGPHLTFRSAAGALVRAYRGGHWLQFSETKEDKFSEYDEP